MLQIDWLNLMAGWLFGTIMGLIPTIFRWIRERDITLENSDLSIHRPLGFVKIQEPRDREPVGDRLTVKGTVVDRRGKPLTGSDIILLIKPTDTEDWYPKPPTSVYPETDGTWKAEVTIPQSAAHDVQVIGLSLSPKSASKLRKRYSVHLAKRPREGAKLARLSLPHAPEMSWPVSRSVLHRTDWMVPAVRDFLEQSNLDLFSIDTAVMSWPCPSVEADWSWKNDRDIQLTIDPKLIDHELPESLRRISEVYKLQHPKKKDSVRYCVIEFVSQPRDGGGCLLLTVRPVTYLAAFPIMDTLQGSLTLDDDDSLRRDRFHKLEKRERPLVPNMLIAHILVISGDNQLILQRRRADKELDYLRGHWSASLEEHFNAPWKDYLSPDKVFANSLTTDNTIFQGLHRAVREELKLNESESENTKFYVLAAGFEYNNFNTALYAMAELPQALTIEKLGNRLKSGEEHDKLAWCSFDNYTLKPTLIDSSLRLDFAREVWETQ